MLEGQVEPALALEPDLISVICGANDVLLSTRPDVGIKASGQQNVYGAGNPAAADGNPPGSTTTPEVVD